MKSWDLDEVEKLARDLWLRQGCPEGRALQHWYEAEEIFREKWLADREGLEHQVRDLRARGPGA
jgi:predicted metal-dependent hydrolase